MPSLGAARRAGLETLPRAALGQLVDDDHVLRGLEAGEAVAHVARSARRRRPPRPGAQHDARPGHLAPALVGHADHGRLEHRRVRGERPSRPRPTEMFSPPGDDEVLLAVDDREVAVGGRRWPRRRCAASRPAAPRPSRRGPASSRPSRGSSGRRSRRSSRPSHGTSSSRVVEHPHVDAEDRQAGGGPPRRRRRLARLVERARERRRRLGHAVAADALAPEAAPRPRPAASGRVGAPPIDTCTSADRSRAADVGVLQQRRRHRRARGTAG